MRYQNVASFEKHLKEAFPDHLSPVYGVIAGCDFERRKMVEKVTALLLRKDPSIQLSRLEAGAHEVKDVVDQLNTQSLFGGFMAVFFDGIEGLKKDESMQLLGYLEKPSHSSFLVLGSATPKALGDLYQKAKKEMIVLDLSDEKPWERQRRLGDWLSDEAKKSGKTITADAVSYLLEHIGLDMAGLCQELAKLICFVGERPLIQKADVEKICVSRMELTSWQLAEKVVWGRGGVDNEKKDELAFILPFIGGLRYQLQVGLQLAELLARETPLGDISRQMPQLRPQTLDKYLPVARQKKADYFRKGLHALFDLEFAAKSAALDLGLLFDRFLATLRFR